MQGRKNILTNLAGLANSNVNANPKHRLSNIEKWSLVMEKNKKNQIHCQKYDINRMQCDIIQM